LAPRRGIAATLATAAVFSVLLVANALVVSGSQQGDLMAAKADAESYLWVRGTSLEGSLGLALMDELQSAVSSQAFPCSGWAAAVQEAVANLPAVRAAGPVSGSGSLSPGGGYETADNLSSLEPFNGWSAGGLDVYYFVSLSGAVPSLGVAFRASQVHRLSMEAELGQMAQLCSGAVAAAAAAFAGAGADACNGTAVAAAIARASSSLDARAAAEGFGAGLSYALSASPRCEGQVDVAVSQAGVQGPEGPFTARVEEEASLPLSP
jgi:hypothetical protein